MSEQVATAAAADIAADALARDRASDPRRSVLLQAPAGSGKTTVLTERLLRLLSEVDQPEEILAITFTRKAAAEMRARVLKALRGEIDATSAQGARMRKFADAALARASARGWDLAQDPGRLRIQTIDSFNFRLATQLTVTAKAGGSLLITERPHELYNRAARQTLAAADHDDQLAADIELLFERLDNNWSNVQRLLADMLRQRGHWLRYVLGHEPGALCERISKSLGEIVSDHLRAAAARTPDALRNQASSLPRVGTLGTDPQSLRAWKQLASLTLTGKGEWRKAITKALGPEYESSSSKEAKEVLKSTIELLSGVPGFREALVELDALPAATLNDSDAAAIEALSRVLRAAAAYLQAEFAVSGRIDHTYVAGAAREALTDAGLPTDLALRTGMLLRHILVDEFQDTSLAQFDLIEMLTAGWEEGDGRTLFVVGDPMQSIYQFREAEVGLFLRARDSGIGSVRLEPLRLTRNFRSVPDLIGWINDAFTTLFPTQDDLRASAVSFTRSVAGRSAPAKAPSVPAETLVTPMSATTVPAPAAGSGMSAASATPAAALANPAAAILTATPAGGSSTAAPASSRAPVQFRLFDNATRESETAAIIERIADLHASEPQSSIAVLVASRSHAAPIITGLEARKIDAVGVDLVPLRELSIVRDLVALMRATSHLGDRTAWLAVLRAPWCGVSLPTLTVLSHRRDKLLVWEAMADEQRLARCSPEEVTRVIRVRGVLDAAMKARNSMPLADWLELTWLRLGAADAYLAQDLRHARAFLAALSERVAGGEWSGPQDLDSLLGDLYAQPQTTASNPVQLMTIHRAKGLEFDHVFVPCLDRDLNRGREPLLRWLDLPRAEGQSDLIMAPVPAIGDDEGGEVTAYLKRLISRRAVNEQTRLLYVAATRAKQTLQLSAAPKARTDGTIAPRYGTLLASLWPAVTSMLAANAEPYPSTLSPTPASPAQHGNATSAATTTPAGLAQRDVAPGTTTPAASALPQQKLRRLIATWSLPTLTTTPDLPHLPISHQSLEPPEFSWVGETARHIGTVVHAALEQYAAASELPSKTAIEAERKFYVYQLRRHGVPEGDLPRAASVVVEALTRTVGNDRGRWIFAPEHRESRSEWALTGIAAGRLTNVVIDRSFIDKAGTRWVIDFKTSRHEGGGLEAFLEQEIARYRPQLETYVALARGMGTAPVRAGLYFPLLDVFRELT
ncbi:MAG TPA: UvrD-helicase domain-containing protein [Steroidobacteraceae bacterium]|nr:UvrD-helicase domain-containing protein [Steroidobacteraceae bacterium]